MSKLSLFQSDWYGQLLGAHPNGETEGWTIKRSAQVPLRTLQPRKHLLSMSSRPGFGVKPEPVRVRVTIELVTREKKWRKS